jgi:hypothetical protein
MLGCLRMSVPDAKSAYLKPRPDSKIGFGEQFQASKFEEDLKHKSKEEYMPDSPVEACKTYVVISGGPDYAKSGPQLRM